MFNKEFYPTPNEVVDIMMKPYLVDRKGYSLYMLPNSGTILDPSAGKGNILERIYKLLDVSNLNRRYKELVPSVVEDFSFDQVRNIDQSNSTYKIDTMRKHMKKGYYAIEIEPELKFILQSKGVRVLANDFLSFHNDIYNFGLIIMNPPFSNGDEHLLKAWEIATETDIVCLLNAETIRNPYTERRKQLCRIIEDNNGEVEYIGKMFTDAERRTDVECCIVRLKKRDKRDRFKFDFIGEEGNTQDKVNIFDLNSTSNGLETYNPMDSYIRSYKKAREAYIEYIKALKKFEYYTEPFSLDQDVIKRIQLDNYTRGKNNEDENFENYIEDLKFKVIEKILDDQDIRKYMTSELYEDLKTQIYVESTVEVNRENINRIVETIVLNYNNNMKKACCKVFDTFTKYHKENREHSEGWKTNKGWCVKKKVILPNYLTSFSTKFDVNYDRRREFEDIEKVMCWLTGKSYGDILDQNGQVVKEGIKSIIDAIKEVNYNNPSLHDSEFFTFRCYKKFTLHITFKDEDLRVRFNQIACDGKNALGWE